MHCAPITCKSLGSVGLQLSVWSTCRSLVTQQLIHIYSHRKAAQLTFLLVLRDLLENIDTYLAALLKMQTAKSDTSDFFYTFFYNDPERMEWFMWVCMKLGDVEPLEQWTVTETRQPGSIAKLQCLHQPISELLHGELGQPGFSHPHKLCCRKPQDQVNKKSQH